MNDINSQIEKNLPLVYSIIHKYVPYYRYDEDIIQLGMIGLWKSLTTYDMNKGSSFSTYAYRCILNEIYIGLRKVNNKVHIDSLDHIMEYSDGSTQTTYNILGTNDDYDYILLREAISKLSPIERKVIYLKYIGYTQKEIANNLGMTQSTCSRIISRIRKKLSSQVL